MLGNTQSCSITMPLLLNLKYCLKMGFPGSSDGTESVCNAGQFNSWVQFLGREDPLEKGMNTHSSILAWRIPCTGEPSWLQPMGLQRVRHD